MRDAKFNNLREPAWPTAYEPLRRFSATLEVRTAANPLSIVSTLRDEIPRVNPALHITGATLQSTQIDNTLLRERLLALLAGFFALVAIVLAAVGLYGVLSYSVLRRTKEIGIRIALGSAAGGFGFTSGNGLRPSVWNRRRVCPYSVYLHPTIRSETFRFSEPGAALDMPTGSVRTGSAGASAASCPSRSSRSLARGIKCATGILACVDLKSELLRPHYSA